MSTRSPEDTKIHIRLITAVVNMLMNKGYKVYADHIGYPNGEPPKFNNFTPDIYAEKGKEKIIIEAETCDSLEDERTRAQWTALSTNKGVDFSVIVPNKCSKKVEKLEKKWGIKIKTMWVLEV